MDNNSDIFPDIFSPTNQGSSGSDIQTLWGYQDFAAGEIDSANVVLTANENGTDAEFIPSKFYDYAEIYREDNSGWVYSSGFFGVFQGLIEVSSQLGAAVTLNKIPAPGIACRIWWVYQGIRPEVGYIAPPTDILNSAATSKLNTLFQDREEKDEENGYVGLTSFKINFKNALNTFTSFFTNSNTAARTYLFQNRDGTIADDTDLALKADKTTTISTTSPLQGGGNLSANRTFSITDASITEKGAVQLSSSYIGTSEDLAVNEKALSDGLATKQPLDATLTSLAALDTAAGYLVQTGGDTFAKRTLSGTANQVSITNGDGAAGNPTFSLPQDIATSSSPTFTNQTLSGNLIFTGISNKITGNFSESAFVNGFSIQSSVVNGNTVINFVPNGSATTAGMILFNNSDVNNSSYFQIQALASMILLQSAKSGSGVTKPYVFAVDSVNKMQVGDDITSLTNLIISAGKHLTVEGVTSTGATGTGKIVFDTSPELITPNIGVANGESLTTTKSLIAGTQLIATSATDTFTSTGETVILTNLSASLRYAASALANGSIINYQLPDATTLPLNSRFSLNNIATNPVVLLYLKDRSGSVIGTDLVLSNGCWNLLLVDNSTADGVWKITRGIVDFDEITYDKSTQTLEVTNIDAFGDADIAGNLAVAGNSQFNGNINSKLQMGGVQFSALRNILINGAMQYDQRYNGGLISITASGVATPILDNWLIWSTPASKIEAQQNAGGARSAMGLFPNFLAITSLANYTPLATDAIYLYQVRPGYSIFNLGWGTASAKPVTFALIVRSSLTGTFGGAVTNATGTRSYPFTFTIDVADTVELKIVTIAGDTGGSWPTTSADGLQINLGIGVGSNQKGAAGAWSSTYYLSAAGTVDVTATLGAYLDVTAIQLEAGSIFSGYDVRTPELETSMINSKPPCFSAYADAATSISNAGPTKVNFQATRYNVGNGYNVATSIFQPDLPGYYDFETFISYTSNAGILIWLYKNGSVARLINRLIGVTAATGNGGGATLDLNGTTDYVEIYAQLSTTLNTFVASPSNTWFEGKFVRPL